MHGAYKHSVIIVWVHPSLRTTSCGATINSILPEDRVIGTTAIGVSASIDLRVERIVVFISVMWIGCLADVCVTIRFAAADGFHGDNVAVLD